MGLWGRLGAHWRAYFLEAVGGEASRQALPGALWASPNGWGPLLQMPQQAGGRALPE